MLDKTTRTQIIQLINEQVVPAMGCTEPIAVALCTARAKELLQQRPEKIKVWLSANMLKNAMGVGIPGTGMIGLPIAIALGAIIGKSEYQLEVIKDLTPQALEQGKQFIANPDNICIKLKENITEKLYIEVTCEAGGNTATAIIAGSHTHFVYEARNGEVLLDKRQQTTSTDESHALCLDMKTVWEFATTTPLDEIRFMLKARDYNIRAAEESKKGNYGHCLGKTIDRPLSHGIFGDTIFCHIISETALACDARMGGAMIPVMSNSGSGNQGICATNPVAVYAKENENTEEELIRALTLSHLTAIYIKQSLGTLSALCGCVVASIGSSLRHRLPNGWRLQPCVLRHTEHDSQPHRYDLRRRQAFVQHQDLLRRVVGPALRPLIHVGASRHVSRGHHRQRCRQEHPQPHEHRP